MIIINLKGGLGNQMFQYALYLKLKSLGKEVKLDTSFVDEGNKGGRIDRFFDIDFPIATNKEVLTVQRINPHLYARIVRKVFGRKVNANVYYDTEEVAQLNIFGFDDIYLDGYWQSEKYFSDIEKDVRESFIMNDNLTDYQKSILSKIQTTESVSVHIRRGDYLNLHEIYGGICTPEYYDRSFRCFDKESVHFIIFTNDYDYVRNHYVGDNITVVEQEQQNILTCNMDLFLMSSCKHNIIANSSFSWWGAWLNANKDKKVIAPRKWLNNKNMKDIWCDGWIKK